ncbi:hypothetical protein D3C73_1659110 [compost metagenome]
MGTQKIGSYEYPLQLNNSPVAFKDLEDLPIKTANGTTVLIRDIGTVKDGNPPQTNIVNVNGSRSVLIPV